MKKILTLFIVFLYHLSFSQGLSPERVSKIKAATVQITLGGDALGTGFFINSNGALITCYHVLSGGPSLDLPFYAKFPNGDSLELQFFNYFTGDFAGNPNAVAYDFIILTPKKPINKKYRYGIYLLKI